MRDQTCSWAHRHGLIGPRGRERLLGSTLLDLGIAMTGRAAPERAEVLLGWFLWMLLLDDRVDNGPWAREGALTEFSSAVTELLRNDHGANHAAVAEKDADPMVAALRADLWARTVALGGVGWRRRFAGHVARHLTAQIDLVRIRSGAGRLTLERYLALRPDLFGADMFFDLMAAIDGVPHERPLSAPELALRAAASDAIAWTNDVFSVQKDLAFGERANLVILTKIENDCSWQAAVDAVHQRIHQRVADFTALRERHPGDPDQRHRATRMAETIRASLDWHRASSRYHGQPADTAAPAVVSSADTPPSLLWPEFERDPYPLYRRLREDFPISYDEPLDAWLLSRCADVRAALSDPRLSSANYAWQLAPMFGRTVMQMEGAEHTAHRSVLTPAFRGRALAVLRDSVRRTAQELVASIRARLDLGEPVDLVAEFTHQLPIGVVVAALGLPRRDVPHFQRWYRAGFSYLGNYRQDPSTLAAGLRARDELYAYLEPWVARRRAHPVDDLLSVLCGAEINGAPLSDDSVKGFCGALLGAGGETTDKALASYLANLLDHPDALAEVQDNPELAPAAWAESLRRNPPVHVVLRQATDAVRLPSGRVPAGATVACLIGSANRDPDQFTDPDRFAIHRAAPAAAREFTAAASHLAFGAGRHFCLGAHLARAEAEIGVAMLVRELPGLRWAPGFTPTEVGLLTRAPTRLMVTGHR